MAETPDHPDRQLAAGDAGRRPAFPSWSSLQQRARERASWDRELDAAGEIADERERARTLAEMAEHLSHKQIREALKIAKRIGDQGARGDALAALAMRISTEGEPGMPRRFAELAVQWARGGWSDRLLMLVSFALIAVVFVALAWICWFWWLPAVWDWGFGGLGWATLFAPFVILYLVIIPFIAFSLAPAITSFWSEYGALRQDVASARETQRDIEQELRANDSQGLVLMLSYSRAVLSEYYAIAMNQAQRSG